MKRFLLQVWLLASLLYVQTTPAYELPAKLKAALDAMNVKVLEVTPKGQGGNCMPLSIACSIQNRNSGTMDSLLNKYNNKYQGCVRWASNGWQDQQYLTACATSVRHFLADKLLQILNDSTQLEHLQIALVQLASLNLIQMDDGSPLPGQIGLILRQMQSAGNIVNFENAQQIIQLSLEEITENRQGMSGQEVAVLLAMAQQQPVLMVNAITPGQVTIVLITPEAGGLALQSIVMEIDDELISETNLTQIQQMFSQAHVHLLFTPGHAQPLLPSLVSDSLYQPSINGIPLSILQPAGSGGAPFTRGKRIQFKPKSDRAEFVHGWKAYVREENRKAAQNYKPESRSYKPLMGRLFAMAFIAGTAGYVYSTNPQGWNQYFWKHLCEGQKDSSSCANAWLNWSIAQCKARYDSACQIVRDGYDYLNSQ